MPDSPSPRALSAPSVLKWTIFLGATVVIVYLCLLVLRPFLHVLAWSGLLAITFYPVHKELVGKTRSPALSALITSSLVVVAILIPMMFAIGVAIDQFLALRVHLLRASEGEGGVFAFEPIRGLFEWVTLWTGVDTTQIADWARQHANRIASFVAESSLTVAASITGFVMSIIFTLFAMFLLFRDGARIVGHIADLLPFDHDRNLAILQRIRDVIYGGVYGVIVIALIQGILLGVTFWALGIPSAALWGTLTVLTSVLPVVGSAAVWVPGVIYLVVLGQWPQAVVLAVLGTFVISAVDNFVRPRLVGDRVGLSELVMFFSLLGGLQVFGLLGIILGPVVFAVAASILDVLRDPGAVQAEPDAETTDQP
jgi:predicted PurR-regulated permease PerM